MSEPVLVGRADLRAAVGSLLMQRRPVVLTGHAGVGKTRLAHAVVADLAGHGLRVVEARGGVVSREASLGAFASLERPPARADSDPASTLWNLQRALLGGDGRNVILSVDDAHFIDPMSMMLVLRIARTSAARLLMTVRRGEDMPPELVALWGDGTAERIEVEPLDRPAIAEMVAGIVGAPLSPATEEEFWRLSRGNPLCAHELAFETVARDAITVVDGRAEHTGLLSVNGRANDIIEARLGLLPPTAARALRLLAAAGALPVTLMERILGLGGLSELERRDLVRVSIDGLRRIVSTTHPLYGELMLQSMGDEARRSALGEIYDAAVGLPRRRAADALTVASWGVDAGRPVPGDLLRFAAEYAMANHSPERAERLARACPAEERDARTVTALAQALVHQGRVEDALRVFPDAEALAESEAERAHVAIAWSLVEALSLGDFTAGLARLQDARSTMTSPEALDGIDAQRGLILLFVSGSDEALDAVRPAIERAPSSGDDALMLALSIGTAASAMAGRTSDALRLSDRARPIIERRPSPTMIEVASVFQMRAYAFYTAGRYVEAVKAGIEARDRYPGLEAICEVGMGLCDVCAGHPTPALRRFDAGLPAVIAMGDPLGQKGWALAKTLEAGAMIGSSEPRFGDVYDELRDLSPKERFQFDADIERCLGIWEMSREDPDPESAARRFRDAADLAEARSKHSYVTRALDELARFGWADEAAPRARAIADVADPEWASAHGIARHAEAAAAGDPAALAEVADEYASWGWLLRAAEICAAASALRGAAGDGAEAYRQDLRSRGFQAEVEGANSLLLRQRRALLSDRLDEIAQMAGEGMSNVEIATSLVLSRRTVENHLHRVYSELGLDGRPELVAIVTDARDTVARYSLASSLPD